MQSQHKKTIDQQGLDRWHHFLRNGRWGTCVDCPTAGDGRKLPELCEHTKRYDHNLQPHDLFLQYLNAVGSHVSVGGVFDEERCDSTATMVALHNSGQTNRSSL